MGRSSPENDQAHQLTDRSTTTSNHTQQTQSSYLDFVMAAPAFDRRRVNGPELSFPPVYEDELPAAESSTSAARMANLKEAAQAYSRNGRNTDAFRPICE